jgi:hypothetical protein
MICWSLVGFLNPLMRVKSPSSEAMAPSNWDMGRLTEDGMLPCMTSSGSRTSAVRWLALSLAVGNSHRSTGRSLLGCQTVGVYSIEAHVVGLLRDGLELLVGDVGGGPGLEGHAALREAAADCVGRHGCACDGSGQDNAASRHLE